MNKATLLILVPVILSSCTRFKNFDQEEAVKINLNTQPQVVIGEEFWEGTADCSARAFLNLTSNSLLFTIEVTDDSVKTGAKEAWMNDGVELYFDLRPPRHQIKNRYEKGVFQAVILPDPGKKQVAPIAWYPGYYDTDIPGVRAYTELRENGYVVQISLPFANLSRAHYWPREKFWFDVAVNDADTGARESQLMWAGKRDNWDNPHNFAEVSFENQDEEEDRKPNFLIILTDRQTLNTLSAYGNPYLHTPYLDDLAEFGTRFTRAYCAAPASSPSRSTLLTGYMPHTTGVNYNGVSPDPVIQTMGDYFRDAGYNTVWAGKWHLPEEYPHTVQEEIGGFTLVDFLDEDELHGLGSVTDEPLADAAARHISRRISQPFLMAVSLQNPQDISYLPQKPSAFPPPPNLKSSPPLPPNHRIGETEPEFITDSRTRTSYGNEVAPARDYNTDEWRNYLYHYHRMIENVDREIGKLLDALEERGFDQNTWVIFTSVSGDGAAAHAWAGNLSLYQEVVNVPFIVTHFGEQLIMPVNTSHLISSADMLPTLMDLAGIPAPRSMQGISFRPVLENPDTIVRKFLITELAIDPSDSTKTGRMITDGRYKYMVYSYGAGKEQLFDLQNDPGETRNLVTNSAYAGIRSNMRKNLNARILKTDDYFIME